MLPALLEHEVTAVFAGLRAATEHEDYQLDVSTEAAYVCAGGIRSTGLSSSMAIAEWVRDGLADAGLQLQERPEPLPAIRMANIGEAFPRPYEDAAMITADPAYGEIVCFCERVTLGELRDAARGPIPASDLDGLRRRTRALTGRCQGFSCGVRVGVELARDRSGRRLAVEAGRMNAERVEVAIVGGGPAGLSAAIELRRRGSSPVVVFEREADAGGIPRYADHLGFGMRDLHRVLSGPGYARRLVAEARRAGVEIRSRTQVTGWSAGGALEVTSPTGRGAVQSAAVVLAAGCRERPRSARLIPGTRPQGVITTGMLQQIVHGAHGSVGRSAVVIGAEHVSFSALETLALAGARTVAMSTELPREQSFAAFRTGAAAVWRLRLRTRTALTAIHGRERVEAVEFTHLDTGAVETVECDTVVLTADWIPDHELAVLGGAALDPGTRGPQVDRYLRTSRPGLFAVGNVLHGAEPADVAALTGRNVATSVIGFLHDRQWPAGRVSIEVLSPLQWIVPNAVAAGVRWADPASERFLLRAREELRRVRVEVVQGRRVVHRQRLARVMPGRSVALDAGWTVDVDPVGPPATVRLRAGPSTT